MAAKKKDEGGIEHFERAAEVQEQTSSDTAHSSYEQAPTPPDSGPMVVQERGKPKAGK